MTFTIGDGVTTVTLVQPMNVGFGTSRRIEKHRFRDSNYAIHDRGKAREQITLNGMELDIQDMYDLDSLADGAVEVTVAGMSDSNRDGGYYINSFRYGRREGAIGRYYYSLILERA